MIIGVDMVRKIKKIKKLKDTIPNLAFVYNNNGADNAKLGKYEVDRVH